MSRDFRHENIYKIKIYILKEDFMNLFNTYLRTWKKWLLFRGRANRKEYIIFTFLNFLFCFPLAFIFYLFSILLEIDKNTEIILILIFSIPIYICHISLTVRRLHDINLSGYWFFSPLIPIFGSVMLLYFCFIHPGNESENEYGNPVLNKTKLPELSHV